MKEPGKCCQDHKPSLCFKMGRLAASLKIERPIRLQVGSNVQRLVIPRPLIPKQPGQGIIKSLNISRHHIQAEEPKQLNLQFSKKLKANHKRILSHPLEPQDYAFPPLEQQDQALSDFSNSLANISSQIIEIPFAKTTITQKAKGSLKQPGKRLLEFDRKAENPVKRSLDKPRNGSQDPRRHVKKISQSKQNLQSSIKSLLKPQATIIFQPKKAGNAQRKPSLADFHLKAIKITQKGSIVYMAIDRRTAAVFALKSTRKSRIKLNIQQFLLQVKLGLAVTHPNIVKIYGFFQEGDNVYVIKEYLEEGGVVEEQKGLCEAVISQYLNQVMFGVIRVCSLVRGDCWHFTPFQMAKSNGILKITNIHLSQRDNGETFSQEFRKTIEYFFETDRRSTFQGLSIQALVQSQSSSGQSVLASFASMLEKMVVITPCEIQLLWQHAFLKQSRLKAIMQE